jgi:transposase InsO family protein
METQTLFSLMWDTGSADSIASMHDKARSIVMTAVLGDEQLEPQYSYIGPALAQALLPTITRDSVHRFLQSKTDYAVDVRPRHRITWNTTPIVGRYVKWQADLISVRNINATTKYPYALTVIDTFSKYAFAFPMTNKSGLQTAQLFDKLFAQRPVNGNTPTAFRPALLLTDQGSEFRSEHTRSVCRHHRVFQLFSHPYKPLGIIERFNQTLKRKLRRALAKRRWTDDDSYVTLLQQLLREYNTTIHSTTKHRPIVVHFMQRQPHADRIQQEALRNTEHMRRQAERRLRNNLAPLPVGAHVRVRSLKDPHRSNKQRVQLQRQMEYKKFGHSHWTRHHFTIRAVDARHNYTLDGHPREKYRREELQPVQVERRRAHHIIN